MKPNGCMMEATAPKVKPTLVTVTELPMEVRFEEGQIVDSDFLAACLYHYFTDEDDSDDYADDEDDDEDDDDDEDARRIVPAKFCRGPKHVDVEVSSKWFTSAVADEPKITVRLHASWSKIASPPSIVKLFTDQIGVPPNAALRKVSSLRVWHPFPFPMPKTMAATQYWDILELVKSDKYGRVTKTTPVGTCGDVLFARARIYGKESVTWTYISKDWARKCLCIRF